MTCGMLYSLKIYAIYFLWSKLVFLSSKPAHGDKGIANQVALVNQKV